MYGFLLGREFKISVAEILSVFPHIKTIYQDKQLFIAENISESDILLKAKNLGGTIKIISLIDVKESVENLIYDKAPEEGNKYHYALSTYGDKRPLKEVLLKIKKKLRSDNISSRFTNKDFKNLSSAQIIGENLVKKGTDYNYVITENSNYFGHTIWVQDIYAYSKRDYSKDRDMQIGMLPPKLSQMMINLSGGKTIYDPFVGLGTILIESLYMGNTKVFGSDLNESMVETSEKNCKDTAENLFLDAKIKTSKLNAKFINESEYFNEGVDAIVTEGYLGEIMTKKNIAIDRIEKQRESLVKIYSAFFENLSKIKYKGNIVITFPFWDFKGKYIFFTEVYDSLEKYCDIQPLFPADFDIQTTKTGSLLYKRDSQLVGREIYKLKIK